MKFFSGKKKLIQMAAAVMAVIMIVLLASAAVRTTASETAGQTGATAEAAGMSDADLDAYRYGLTGYTMQELLVRNLTKKSVAYVTLVLNGSNDVVEDKDIISGGYYRYALVEGVNTLNPAAASSYASLSGITYDYFSEADPDMILYEDAEKQIKYYVVSAVDLLDADIIVTAGCISQDAFVASLGHRTYQGVLIADIPQAFSQEKEKAANALANAYLTGCAYSEIINPVDLCAFYYNYSTGTTERAKLSEKVNEVFAATRFFRGYANTLNDNYDPENVRDMIRFGTWFVIDNRDIFSQGAFESKGMGSWEPDLAGILFDRSFAMTLD